MTASLRATAIIAFLKPAPLAIPQAPGLQVAGSVLTVNAKFNFV
jgi:hypothetical protein